MNYIIVLAILAVIAIFCYLNNNWIQVSNYKLAIGAKQPFRVVQLSDLHSKQFGKGNKKLVKAVANQNPDMIVFTGDLVDDSGKRWQETVDFLCGLKEIAPTYYIYGNHERRTSLMEDIRQRLENSGVIVLQNQIVETDLGPNHLVIMGLDENQAEKKNYRERRNGTFVYEDNSKYFAELDKYSGMKLILTHFPENFDNPGGYVYKNYDYDLQFSGHAHGGQFRLPFIGGVFSPGQGINPRFYQGVHGTHPYMIVSRGLGNSSFPLRLFNRPNLVVADIV